MSMVQDHIRRMHPEKVRFNFPDFKDTNFKVGFSQATFFDLDGIWIMDSSSIKVVEKSPIRGNALLSNAL